MSSKLKFWKREVQLLDLPNLLINIWEYNEPGCKNQCPVCIPFEKWCIEVVQEKWKANYLDCEYVIKNLQKQNKNFYHFRKVSSQDRDVIYNIIHKW